jgi:hypothetical protein
VARPKADQGIRAAGVGTDLRMFEYFAGGAAEIAACHLGPKSFKTVMGKTFFGRIDGGPSGEASPLSRHVETPTFRDLTISYYYYRI